MDIKRKEIEKLKKDELIAFAEGKNIKINPKGTKEQIVEEILNNSDEKKAKRSTMARLASRNTERMGNRRAYTVNPEDRNKPIDSPDDIAAAQIRTSMRDTNSLCLKGTIFSVVDKKVGNRIIYTALIKYENYKVMIPAQLLVPLSEEELKDNKKVKEICENRIGSEVDFKVLDEGVDEHGIPIATASRIAAMEIIRKKMWFARNRDGDWKFKEDEIAEGRIASITQAGIFVEIAGVETFIPNKDLSHTPIYDARKMFSPNDKKVNVYIKSIARNVETNEVVIEATVKDTKSDDRRIKYEMIDDYSLCGGVVEKINFREKGEPQIIVRLDQDYICYCKMGDGSFTSSNLLPEVGNYVRVRVKKEGKLRVNGIIQHISRPQV